MSPYPNLTYQVELLLDRLHEDLNRVRGPKPFTPRSEGPDDAQMAREQWQKTLQRDDSPVFDLTGGLTRCLRRCRLGR